MIYRFLSRMSILPAVCASALIVVLLTIPHARADVTDVDRRALEALIAEGVPVIDVRREDEWRARGLIAGSHPLTFFDARGGYDVEAWLAGLADIAAPDEPFVLICAHGVRSKRIADLLDSRLGFSAVHNVRDGFEGWRDDGGPVAPYAP